MKLWLKHKWSCDQNKYFRDIFYSFFIIGTPANQYTHHSPVSLHNRLYVFNFEVCPSFVVQSRIIFAWVENSSLTFLTFIICSF